MARPLKVLIIDDSESDAFLIINALTQNGFDVSSGRVETAEGLKDRLAENEWDIIICDYIMPAFSVMDALAIVSGEKVKTPFIVLSGMLNSEIAPDLIKAGASDFVSKEELPKLVAAVEREIGRSVKEVEEIITREEKKLTLISKSGNTRPFMTIRRRFAMNNSIIALIVILYCGIMAIKGAHDSGTMAFQKASAVAGAIISAVEGFQYYDISSGMNLDAAREYLKDTGNTLHYDFAFLDTTGAAVSIYGNISSRLLESLKTRELQKTMDDGRIRSLDVYSGRILPVKMLIARLKNPSGKTAGIMALDYTKDYLTFLKYGIIHAGVALSILLAVLGVTVISGYFIKSAILGPVEMIKNAMESIAAGDLSQKMKVKNYDEMGELAYSFDKMRESLKGAFEKLKTEIREKHVAEQALQVLHLKLTRWVSELDKRTHEITILNQMGKMLQSCKSVEEFHSVTMRYAEQLFPADHGAVYLFNDSGKFMEAVCMWGKEPIEHGFGPDDCWSLRSGHLYAAEAPENLNMLCGHIKARGVDRNFIQTVCVPMMAQGETIGMFHLRAEQKEKDPGNITAKRKFAKEQLVVAVAEHITLALSNLKLQDTLRQQSIHDSLTGLFNRRYMKDSLEREIYRAKRHNIPFGIIMIDIDYFKKFNDEYGHEVGDLVLEKIGRLVKNTVRPEDIPCRYGGEEFLIILPGADREGTNQCASRLLEETRKMKIKNKGTLMGGITISLGVSSYPVNGDTLEEIVKAADTAMFGAKNAGRDCIILSDWHQAQQAAH